MLNMLNHVGSNVPKMCFFLLKCWICWICWIILGLWKAKGTTRGKIIQHIQHFSRKKHFFKNVVLSGEIIQHSPKSDYFMGNNSTCVSNVLLSAEMLNMLNHVGSNFRKMCFFLLKCWICWICWIILGLWKAKKGPNRPKIIQHIQHIQHFSRKKHFFQKRHSTWSNIFNISAERSTFLKKMLLSGEKFNMAQKVVLSGEIIQHSPKSGYFRGNNSTCVSNVLLSAEMLNMLNHVGSNFRKMCFFLLKCWICWICWIILGLWKAKRDQIDPK